MTATLEDLAASVDAALGSGFSGKPYTRGTFQRVFLRWHRIDVGEAWLVGAEVAVLVYPRGDQIVPQDAAARLTRAVAAK